ncbi:hypothetical protein BDN72DRAFT_878721 [Pluteus cervinus]|uniref:Uncharacterized protein n=1 Tax=Pluteus cervinus TaxID=181527 RepID=A0ACD3ATE7_9AGAR|nr:hypothetical protein BDN72DRAFT_878721 [Pluteus cervinus]
MAMEPPRTNAISTPASTTTTLVAGNATTSFEPLDPTSCSSCTDTNLCPTCHSKNTNHWSTFLSPPKLPLPSTQTRVQLRSILGFALATSELPLPPCGGYPSISIISEILGISAETINALLGLSGLTPWPVKFSETSTLEPPYISPSLRMFLTEGPASTDPDALFPIDLDKTHRMISFMCWARFHGYGFDSQGRPHRLPISPATKLYSAFAWAQHYLKSKQRMGPKPIGQFPLYKWFEWICEMSHLIGSGRSNPDMATSMMLSSDAMEPINLLSQVIRTFVGPTSSPFYKHPRHSRRYHFHAPNLHLLVHELSLRTWGWIQPTTRSNQSKGTTLPSRNPRTPLLRPLRTQPLDTGLQLSRFRT